MAAAKLKPIELVALGCLVKADALKAAKSKIADGSSQKVDFCVRISGSLQKGTSTEDVTVKAAATVDLRGFDVACALLRKLGVGAKRLASALADLKTDGLAVDDELAAVFLAEETARAAKLPKVDQVTKGKVGTVQSQLTATKLKPDAAKLAG